VLEIIFATKNLHKVEELKKIAPKSIEIAGLPEGIAIAPEYGETFLENAIGKAMWYMKIVKKPVVADDSGLEIDALKGFPGVFSSRFMEGEDYKKKMEKILKMLENEENRRARFVCYAVYASPDGIVVSAKGTVEGKISQNIRGSKGFGYDPIFIPDGYEKTFGELGEDIKNSISHRYKAFENLFKMLKNLDIF